jgi:hypothetical protein
LIGRGCARVVNTARELVAPGALALLGGWEVAAGHRLILLLLAHFLAGVVDAVGCTIS